MNMPRNGLKASYLKKLGGLHLAKEATDLEDHREVLKMNRAAMKRDYGTTLGENGITQEAIKMDSDEMHVGDQVHNHYYENNQSTTQPKTVESGWKNVLAGILMTAAGVAGGAGAAYLLRGDAQDYVNQPTVEVEGGQQE